jgi:hypothetical protein
MSGIFYGKEQFDAQLIISQMVCMQALHYLGMGVSFLLMDTLLGVPMSLDQFFSDRIFADGIMTISKVRPSFSVLMQSLCPHDTCPSALVRGTNACTETY